MKMNTKQIVRLLISTSHVPVRAYTDAKVFVTHFGSVSPEDDPFLIDSNFAEHLLKEDCTQLPFVYVECEAIYWYVVSGQQRIYVIGPACTRMTDQSLSTSFFQLHHVPAESNYHLSFCDASLIGRLVLFLHNWLHDTEVDFYEFVQKRFLSEEIFLQIRKNISNSHFSYQEQDILHNPFDREVREMNCIRQGNREMLERVLNESFAGQYGKMSRDELRSVKYLAVCGIVLASRAAIDGGLLPEVAFTVTDSYIRQIDAATSKSQIIALGQEGKYYFADLVRSLGDGPTGNRLIQDCKEKIIQHLHSSFTIKQLAEELHVNPDYLSKLFLREEKINLKQYITRQKVLAAQNLLIYSDKDYSDIGYTLGYSSQSHFIRAFQRETGLTPSIYRKLHQP